MIGFKLTVGADDAARQTAVDTQFSQAGVDVVVQNDLEEIRANPEHLFRWFTAPEAHRELVGVTALAQVMDEFLQEDHS